MNDWRTATLAAACPAATTAQQLTRPVRSVLAVVVVVTLLNIPVGQWYRWPRINLAPRACVLLMLSKSIRVACMLVGSMCVVSCISLHECVGAEKFARQALIGGAYSPLRVSMFAGTMFLIM